MAAKTHHFAADILSAIGFDHSGASQCLRKAFDFEREAFVRRKGTDSARRRLRQIDMIEQRSGRFDEPRCHSNSPASPRS